MDPYDKQRLTRYDPNSSGDNTPGESGQDQRSAPDSGGPQTTAPQPRCSDGFTMIPPNESRRNKLKTVAQKEVEDLQRWREANRVTSVHMTPEKLGGNATLAEVRQKQFTDLRCSKLQKKLKKEELDKRRRQEEEAQLQKMKAEKREMAERLEERKRQEQQRRGEKLWQDHLRTTESFLQRFERRAPGPLASGRATHTSSRKEESTGVREVQLEHKRVNSAFLDKLEGRGRGTENETKGEGIQEAEYPCFASEDFRHNQFNSAGQHFPLAHLDPDPEQSCSGWTEEADLEPDHDWALMKLTNCFPACSRVFLEDILDQCNSDYEKAYTLLICTLN
ncbi:epithelial-stromal interaction protein 1 [Chaetodon auriga]|uniref:epithelial-stromal interaction protein 1 n=1 Tax=Chaetodon auriga TaxID=39042 RepID=UPI004032D7C1